VGIGLTKIIVKTDTTVRLIHLNNQLKGTVSIGSATITTGSILFSTLTSVISNIIRIRIVNTIEVILNIIRIGNTTKTTKTNRIIKTIVVIRITTRTSKIVNKAANSAEDLALSLV